MLSISLNSAAGGMEHILLALLGPIIEDSYTSHHKMMMIMMIAAFPVESQSLI